MRALIHNPGAVSALAGKLPSGFEVELAHEAALRAAAGRLGKSNLLPMILVSRGEAAAELDLIRHLRQDGFISTIMVLEANRSGVLVSAYLNAGADDVMHMPADSTELLARLSAISRRSHGIPTEAVRVGALQIYLDGRHPELAGTAIALSAREYQILRYLALNLERVVPKAAIYDALYALCAMPPFDKIIDVYICRLRAKFAKLTPQGERYIETVAGRGYRLRAPSDCVTSSSTN